MIRRPPRSTLSSSSAASDVYKRQMMYGLLMLLVVTNDVSGFIQLMGAGGTVHANVFIAWMAAYRSLRSPFVDVRLSYNARSSGFGKRAIAAGSVSYAGTESVLSDAEYDQNPDLQMFPALAGLASHYIAHLVTSTTHKIL